MGVHGGEKLLPEQRRQKGLGSHNPLWGHAPPPQNLRNFSLKAPSPSSINMGTKTLIHGHLRDIQDPNYSTTPNKRFLIFLIMSFQLIIQLHEPTKCCSVNKHILVTISYCRVGIMCIIVSEQKEQKYPESGPSTFGLGGLRFVCFLSKDMSQAPWKHSDQLT